MDWNLKLFEEIARSLRLVKGDHQPEVLEPETPASAPEVEIIVPSDAAARHAGFSPELRDTIRVIRHDVLATLRQVPAFVSAAQKMASEGCLYRVLVSEEHVHLLREGADGIVNPFLRDAEGRFVENVDLIRVPPNFAGAIAAIAINAAMAEISAKLDIVATTVENLAELMRVANLGALQGAIDALQVARQLRDADRRRKQMLDACQEIVVQLGVIAGQMAAHVKEMPSENTGFWSGWNGDRIATAEKTYARVRDDFAVLLEGLQRAVAAYLEVGEFAAAAKVFSLVCNRIDASPQLAADRARFLPYPNEGERPERIFEDFLVGKPTAEARLQALAGGVRPVLALVFHWAELVRER
jgi:hypothetical protein